MELSDEQISRIWDAHTVPVFGKTGINPIVFARAIEAEVRKGDEALIRQMLEALDTAFHQTCSVGRPKDWEQIRNALHSARARLEGKP